MAARLKLARKIVRITASTDGFTTDMDGTPVGNRRDRALAIIAGDRPFGEATKEPPGSTQSGYGSRVGEQMCGGHSADPQPRRCDENFLILKYRLAIRHFITICIKIGKNLRKSQN